MNPLKLLALAGALCTVLSSCHVPSSEELFIRSDQMKDSMYVFPVKMDDGTKDYTVSFYTIMDRKGITSLPLAVRWVSPSGKVYVENVSMKVGDSKGDIRLYRSNLEPYEYGVWGLKIKVLKDIPGFRGIGVICERNSKENGTRQTP
ncbi:MAG: hypothetical protein MJY61_04985 [Bacteroidales bacterium]|nr:hypothetical protein [Bacteroidales bacterium]